MRLRFIYIVLTLCFLASTPYTGSARENVLYADSVEMNNLITNLQSSFEQQDPYSLLPLLDQTVEVSLLGSHNTLSQSHTLILLNGFYDKYKPSNFSIDYKSNNENRNYQYLIGTAKGKKHTFKIYFFLKYKSLKWLIQELRIVQI